MNTAGLIELIDHLTAALDAERIPVDLALQERVSNARKQFSEVILYAGRGEYPPPRDRHQMLDGLAETFVKLGSLLDRIADTERRETLIGRLRPQIGEATEFLLKPLDDREASIAAALLQDQPGRQAEKN